MAVAFMDLARIHKPLKEEMLKAFEEVLTTSEFILGPAVSAFEQDFARRAGGAHAIGVASGTDALVLCLQAIEIAAGDEIIVPAFGFVATAEAVVRLGGSVVFVDVNEDYTIDLESARAAVTERTKAIIAVHLFGMAADVVSLAQIAADYGIYLIEDVAQAAGGRFAERGLGTYGIAGCFSFYPTKNLGALGDGGLVLTDSDEMAERIRLFHNHGRDRDSNHALVGYNSRLDAIQASMLKLKLASLDEDNADRIANAQFYETHLDKESFVMPAYHADGSHVYNQYTIRHPERDELRKFLNERQIDTRVYYPKPLHLEASFAVLGYREGHFPQAELMAQEVLSMPIYPGLTRHELDEVVHTLDLYAKTHPVSAAPSG